jgi:hypothetical protein
MDAATEQYVMVRLGMIRKDRRKSWKIAVVYTTIYLTLTGGLSYLSYMGWHVSPFNSCLEAALYLVAVIAIFLTVDVIRHERGQLRLRCKVWGA